MESKKRVRVSLNVQGGNRDADVEDGVEHSGGRRHSWDNQERWHANTAVCKTASQREAAAQPRGLSSALSDDVWGRERAPRGRGCVYTVSIYTYIPYNWSIPTVEVYLLFHVVVKQKLTQHSKAIRLQLKRTNKQTAMPYQWLDQAQCHFYCPSMTAGSQGWWDLQLLYSC